MPRDNELRYYIRVFDFVPRSVVQKEEVKTRSYPQDILYGWHDKTEHWVEVNYCLNK